MNQRQRRILAYARQHGNSFTNQVYQKVSEVGICSTPNAFVNISSVNICRELDLDESHS